MIDIRIQSNEFDFGQEVKNFQNNKIDGAVVCFLGSVRDLEPKETLEKLEIEYYPKMAKKVLNETAKKAFKKWNLSQCLIIHRFGELEVNEPIVLVITQTKHRKDAFEANEYIIDFLKINAPFWKKEHSPKGAKWVKQNKRDLEINF
ncbi:MAG: molybdenum cofactor biosynthesis protein MoaE [Candidatus Dadabacteria bacterium]|nr:MAG: molybdenum cofactor biosynthesis protein MoaE [Candidatus Dadabacteria bacterium]